MLHGIQMRQYLTQSQDPAVSEGKTLKRNSFIYPRKSESMSYENIHIAELFSSPFHSGSTKMLPIKLCLNLKSISSHRTSEMPNSVLGDQAGKKSPAENRNFDRVWENLENISAPELTEFHTLSNEINVSSRICEKEIYQT